MRVAVAAVLLLLVASPSFAQPLQPQALSGVTGRDLTLLAGPGGAKVYLFAATPQVVVKTFDVATGTWDPGVLLAPGSQSVYLRWGGPTYAVDGTGGLHVAWSEGDFCECDYLANPNWAGVRVWHVVYHLGVWAPAELLLERQIDDSICFFHHVSMAADGSGRLILAYLAGGIGLAEHRGYLLHDGTSWSADNFIGTYKGSISAGGFAGSLFAGYYVGEGGNFYNRLMEIPPGVSQPNAPISFLLDDAPSFQHVPGAPGFAFSGTTDVHMVWPESCSPSWYYCRMLYNHRSSGVWDFGTGGVKLYDASFFADQGTEDVAKVAMAASDLGPVLVAFTFRRTLYLVASDGATWTAPSPVGTITTDAHYPAVARISSNTFLVAWTDRVGVSGQVYYGTVTVCQAGQSQCGSVCADLTSDPAHCGSCDHPCSAGDTCVASHCVPDPPPADGGLDGGAAGDGGPIGDGATVDASSLASDGAAGDGGGSPPTRMRTGCACNGAGIPVLRGARGDVPVPGWFLLLILALIVQRRGRLLKMLWNNSRTNRYPGPGAMQEQRKRSGRVRSGAWFGVTGVHGVMLLPVLIAVAVCFADTASLASGGGGALKATEPQAAAPTQQSSSTMSPLLRAAYITSVQQNAGESYRFDPSADGTAVVGSNAAQGLSVELTQGALRAGPDGSETDWSFELRWSGVGRPGAIERVSQPTARAQLAQNRASYARGDGSEEWYLNGPLGIEHRQAAKGCPLMDGPTPI